jgi:predicted ATP-binding protein involved in virulence
VFRFERVEFVSIKSGKQVDYVALSDGEHQLAQILGTACMASYPNVLFLLDEPESHFNPDWRIEFIKKLLTLPTNGGMRSDRSLVAQQECLITTHSPFIPSDMQSDNVFIFEKDEGTQKVEVRNPLIQTYGSRFDAILAECFKISPPISALSRDFTNDLLKNGGAAQIEKAISELGESSVRMRLAAKLSQLKGEQ